MLTREDLHNYQRKIIRHIIDNEGAGVFADMGLGKTTSTLTAVDDLMFDYIEIDKCLVIAPLRVADSTWAQEGETWEHLKHVRFSKILGNESDRVNGLKTDADVYLINREQVVWLIDYTSKVLRRWPFDMIVIDELTSFKNPSSKRFKALKKVLPLTKRVVGLTGTPSPNGLMDLWAEVYLLDQGKRLGKTITNYRNKYFYSAFGNGHITYKYGVQKGADKEINNLIGDICISMSKEDYLDMPPLNVEKVQVSLTNEERKVYRSLERDYIVEVGSEEITAMSAATLSNKLLQLAGGAVYNEEKEVVSLHDAKLDMLSYIVENTSDNILVGYNYKHEAWRIKEHFKSLKPRIIDTDKDIRDWNNGKVRMMLCHPASAGHGLNLQRGGHTIVWFSPTWNLEHYQQFNARLYRQGQTDRVNVYILCATGTIDERVCDALEKKKAGQKALMNAIKAIIRNEKKK